LAKIWPKSVWQSNVWLVAWAFTGIFLLVGVYY
jgi:hypothetical protein